jgi:hypothetical protein
VNAIGVAVALETAELEPGDSIRIVCPECHGGSSRERSMNVTRTEDGATVYLCWRASCEARGAVGGSPNRLASLVRTRERTYKTKDPEIAKRFQSLNGGLMTVGHPGWHISSKVLWEFNVLWDPDTSRYALPVYGPTGVIRGWILRSMQAARVPKTLAHPILPEPQLGWNRQRGTQVVVVEDIPSAIRLGEFGIRAVSLCGVHLTDEAIDELAEEAEDVVWALDRDAYAKACALDRAHRLHFNNSTAILLPCDFKDQTDAQVVECLQSVSFLRFSSRGTPTNESGTCSAPI